MHLPRIGVAVVLVVFAVVVTPVCEAGGPRSRSADGKRYPGLALFRGKLTAADAADGDGFGNSVSIYGDTAVIGASVDDHDGVVDAGSAYVYRIPMIPDGIESADTSIEDW